MTPKKLPSGSYRLQVYLGTVDGKSIRKSVTAPTKAECELKAAQLKLKYNPASVSTESLTVRAVVEQYISLSELLSPTTLSNYNKILAHGFQSLMPVKVSDLTSSLVQVAINSESKRTGEKTGKTISAKTVKNEWALISSALKTVCNLSFAVKLPKIQHKNEMLPEPEQVLSVIKGNPAELPCLLAAWCGMRMSEIRGLKFSDVKDGWIYINRVKVEVNCIDVVKDLAKTDSSIRKIKLPDYISQLINNAMSERKAQNQAKNSPKDDFIIDMTRDQIYHYFTRAMEKSGIKMSFHDLRHLFASVMLNHLQVPQKIVQLEGGWSTPQIMNKVYSQGTNSAQNTADLLRDSYFENLLGVQKNAQSQK